MTRKDQKNKEREYVDLFLQNATNLNKYQIIAGEQPDFIIAVDDKKIGIEITNLFYKNGHHSSSAQSQIAKRVEVIKNARSDYLNRNNNLYDFNFNFDLSHPIENVRKVALRLSRSLESILKENYRTEEFRLDDCPEVFHVHSNFKKYSNPKWNIAQVYDVPNIDLNNLAEVIEQKKLKLKNYQECDSQWLVIIIEYWDPAQDQIMNISGTEFKAKPFDKIYIYKPATQECIVFE